MKKIPCSLSVLLLLTACSAKTLKDDKVLYTINGVATKDSDFYSSMKNGDDGTIIVNNARTSILKNLTVKDEAELQATIDGNIKELEAMFGDNLIPYLQSVGFNSIEDFIEKQVKPSMILEVLANEQLEKDKDSLINTYNYKHIEYLFSAKKEFIDSALTSINNGAKFSEIELDENSKYIKDTFSNASVIPSKALDKYLKTEQKIGTSEILFDEESNLYFIVNNLAVDLETEFETVAAYIIQKEDYFNIFSGQLFIDNGFNVYDKELIEKMKLSFPNYIK